MEISRRSHYGTDVIHKAFLKGVERRSLPCEDIELDAIHSLQLTLKGSLQDGTQSSGPKALVVQVDVTMVRGRDELQIVANEMVHLIKTVVVSILAVDSFGRLNRRNMKAAELTGFGWGGSHWVALD
uniref:Uncharacterized protein n=1 Tax=Nymphaea colorata TaxID=210225 RepID=A0A5K0VHN6_9MAGN